MKKFITILISIFFVLLTCNVVSADETDYDPKKGGDLTLQCYFRENLNIPDDLLESKLGLYYERIDEMGNPIGNIIGIPGEEKYYRDITTKNWIKKDNTSWTFTVPKKYLQDLKKGSYSVLLDYKMLVDKNDEDYEAISELLKDAEENQSVYTGDDLASKHRYNFMKSNGNYYEIAGIAVGFTVIGEYDFGFYLDMNGKFYWYEGGVKQGVYGSPGNVSYDGTERGREIYDPVTDGWYWLDSIYDGAKAENKEVFMPYIYQNEDTFDENQMNQVVIDSDTYTESFITANMGEQVKKAIENKTGKWVRYDWTGKMIKGWYKVTEYEAEYYPTQVGNVYYYDYKTGLMAKGKTIIDGETYYFDEITGVCQNSPDWIKSW